MDKMYEIGEQTHESGLEPGLLGGERKTCPHRNLRRLKQDHSVGVCNYCGAEVAVLRHKEKDPAWMPHDLDNINTHRILESIHDEGSPYEMAKDIENPNNN